MPRPPRGESTNAVAAGDLSVRTASARRDELGDLGRSFDGMTTAVAKQVVTEDAGGAFQRISAGAVTLQEALGEVATVSEQTSASTQQVSASTEETSASAEEIAATAREVAGAAEDLNRIAARFHGA